METGLQPEGWKECIKAATQSDNVRGTKTDTSEDLLWERRSGFGERGGCARRRGRARELGSMRRTKKKLKPFSGNAANGVVESVLRVEMADNRRRETRALYTERSRGLNRGTINSCSKRAAKLIGEKRREFG